MKRFHGVLRSYHFRHPRTLCIPLSHAPTRQQLPLSRNINMNRPINTAATQNIYHRGSFIGRSIPSSPIHLRAYDFVTQMYDHAV